MVDLASRLYERYPETPIHPGSRIHPGERFFGGPTGFKPIPVPTAGFETLQQNNETIVATFHSQYRKNSILLLDYLLFRKSIINSYLRIYNFAYFLCGMGCAMSEHNRRAGKRYVSGKRQLLVVPSCHADSSYLSLSSALLLKRQKS